MTPTETVSLLHSTTKSLEEMSRTAAGRDALCPHLDKLTEVALAMFLLRNNIEARNVANIEMKTTVVNDCQGEIAR